MIAQELDYAPALATNPSYRYSKLVPQSGTQSVSLSTNQTTETLIEVPTKCVNLSRSVLQYQVYVPELASNTTSVHTSGLPSIDRLSCYTRSGVYICDINNVDKFYRVVAPRTTKFAKMNSADKMAIAATSALATSVGHYLHNSNALSSASKRVDNAGTALTNSDKSYSEQEYIQQGVAADGSGAGHIYYNVQMELGEMVHTVLNIDKDLYFGEIMVLRIQWAPSNRLGFVSLSAAPTLPTVAISTACTINNIALYLAVESNPDIISALVAKVNTSGIQLVVPYVHTYKNSASSSTYIATQQRLNRGHGSSLLRVYSSLFNGAESGATVFNNTNIASAKYTSFYTSMDSMRLQDSDVNVANNEDYLMIKDALEGSCIQNSGIFKYNACVEDDFTGFRTSDASATDSIQNGLSLEAERLYQVNLNAVSAASQNLYSFFICQKLLVIGGGSIQLM